MESSVDSLQKFGKSGPFQAGRNTLNQPRKTPKFSSSNRGHLTTTTSRGDNVKDVKQLAPHVFSFQADQEFPDLPDLKRRKMDHTQPREKDTESATVIDLDREDDAPSRSAVERTSRNGTREPPGIPPPITGVQESRNVDRIMNPSFSQYVGAQRSKGKLSLGHTQDQPVELDDESQISNTQASNGPTDTMTALDNNLIIDLKQVDSQNKRRPDSTATTSRHFPDPKRPKTAMADLVDASDDELEEVAPPRTNGAKRNGRVAAGPDSLRHTFKRDDRVSRLNRSPFHRNGEDESMADELGETPEKAKKPRGSSKPTDKTRSKSEPFEIAETPSPKDDYVSQGDIAPTPFRYTDKASGKKGKVAKKQSSRAHREDVYPLASYRDMDNQVGHDQPGLYLELNDKMTGFDLRFDDSFIVTTIESAQIVSLSWSMKECRLVRLSGSRDSASKCNRIWDLEFHDQESAKKFALQLKGVKRYARQPYGIPLCHRSCANHRI